MIKCRKVRRTGHVATIEKGRRALKTITGNPT